MNIFNKVALQGLKKNRTRTIVTIIGVILSAAMMTAVASFGISLLNYMTEGASQKYGDWHIAVLDADISYEQERRLDEQVTDMTAFQNIGYAPLEGSKNPHKPYLFIAGFHEETFDTLPISLLSGRLPENGTEIVVSGKIAADGGVSYGVEDTITLDAGSRMNGKDKLNQSDPYTADKERLIPQEKKTYRVVGICQTPVFEKDSWPGYTLITRADAADAGEELSLFVTLKNPRQIHSYADTATAGHAYIMNNDVLRFMGLSEDPADRIFNALLYSAGGIVIAIIMIGSVFLIYNSFSISLNERTRQIGILSSVGATAKQLRNSVLFEGLCIGAAGIPIGVLAGTGSMGLVIELVSRNFRDVLYSTVPLTLTVSAPAIFVAAAVSLVTILISAYIPAKKAVSMPVMECIRQTNEVKVESTAVRTSELAQRLYGLEGILALKNFKRNKKRYRSIVLSLVLSVVLFISTSAFVTDLKTASEQAKVVTDYDIGFGTQDMDDSEMLQLYRTLKRTQGVSKSTCQTVMEYSCTVPAGELSDEYWKSAGGASRDKAVDIPMIIQFLDDSTYRSIIGKLGLSAEEYAGKSGRVIALGKMLSSNQETGLSQLPDMFTNSSVTFTIPQCAAANLTCTFVEIMPPDMPPMIENSQRQPYIFQVMAPWSLKEKLITADTSEAVKVKGLTFQSDNPSQSAAGMKKAIQDQGITSAYLLLNTSDVLEESRNIIFIVNVFAYTFIFMISLIAVANVFNTISTNIKLRRQELAMLRSVGMSNGDFNKMMRFECFFYGMKALLFGLPLAGISSWLIYKGLVIGGADIGFAFPWSSMAVSVFSVFSVVFITMLYAVNRIKRENIIDALRDDMT